MKKMMKFKKNKCCTSCMILFLLGFEPIYVLEFCNFNHISLSILLHFSYNNDWFFIQFTKLFIIVVFNF